MTHTKKKSNYTYFACLLDSDVSCTCSSSLLSIALYIHCDLVHCPSAWKPVSMVFVLEAMSHNIPVLQAVLVVYWSTMTRMHGKYWLAMLLTEKWHILHEQRQP